MEDAAAVTAFAPENTEMVRRILIIQTAFIGDAILVEPLIRAAGDYFPQAAIDVLVIPAAAGLFSHHPRLDQVISYDKRGKERGLAGFLDLLARLRKRRYDLALVPHRSLRSALLAWLSRIPIRVGFDTSAGSFLLTHRKMYLRPQHEILRNVSLLDVFGCEVRFSRPQLFLQPEERKKARELMPDAHKVIALAPGSVWATKRWPVESFVRLQEKILSDPQLGVVLIGGAEDSPLCRQIAGAGHERVVDLCGQLSLRESCALLERCAALVTNDSAPTHLGLAAGTRVLTIFGATVPEFGFYPYGEKNHSIEPPRELDCRPCGIHGGRSCPIKTFECMRSITPEYVWRELMQVIAQD